MKGNVCMHISWMVAAQSCFATLSKAACMLAIFTSSHSLCEPALQLQAWVFALRHQQQRAVTSPVFNTMYA
jgi:hypothetical protein